MQAITSLVYGAVPTEPHVSRSGSAQRLGLKGADQSYGDAFQPKAVRFYNAVYEDETLQQIPLKGNLLSFPQDSINSDHNSQAEEEEEKEKDRKAQLVLADFAAALQQCSTLEEIMDTHERSIRAGLDGNNILGNHLINSYRKVNKFICAHLAFERIHTPNVVSWTSLISVYAGKGRNRQALELFKQMRLARISANRVTYITLLGACANLAALPEGRLIHGQLVFDGYEHDVCAANALITMYGRCGELEDARDVFDEIPKRTIVSCTAMVSAYARANRPNDALQLYNQLQKLDMCPSRIMFTEILFACANAVDIREGKSIHQHILAERLEKDLLVGTALVNMYGKCGVVEDAYQVFLQLNDPDVICWNSMINVYASHGYGTKAIKLYEKMLQERVIPNRSTLLAVLVACVSASSLEYGMVTHSCVVKHGFLPDVAIESTLIKMYGKYGALAEVQSVFERMRVRNLVSWNSIISAYAQYGQIMEVARLLYKMLNADVKPDGVTFVGILSACCHDRLLEQGCLFFVYMVKEYGITPMLEHYGCMVDLFARAERLEEAEDLCDTLPVYADACIWRILFSACRSQGDIKREHCIGEHLTSTDLQSFL